MNKLTQLIQDHTALVDRADCDVDMILTGVKLNIGDVTAEVVRQAISEYGGMLDIFDGKEHSFIQMGGWLGDQGYALRLMALLSKLEMVNLLTPKTVIGAKISDEMAVSLAGQGLMTIVCVTAEPSHPLRLSEQIKLNIAKYGWHMQYVFPNPDSKNETERHFFYTVGLTDMGLPEIFMMGNIDPSIAHMVFSIVIEDWKKKDVVEGVHLDYIQDREGRPIPMLVKELDTTYPPLKDEFATFTFNHYGDTPLRFAQLIWSDQEGRFPSDPNFSLAHEQQELPCKVVRFDA